MNQGVETWHLLFSGRVQGVGFRYVCARLATELQVDGWVRNLTNGQVELTIQADADRLQSLVDQICQTMKSKIVDVQQNRAVENEAYDSFQIRTTV